MIKKIFVIDDDEKLNVLLQNYLTNFGFQVVTFTDPKYGLDKIRKDLPDLVILDVMMPEMDGFTLCKEIRKESQLPIILLTARGDVTDRIVGLEIGADDYLSKPFEPRELVARIQTILRRSSNERPIKEVIRIGRLEIHPEKQIIMIDGNQLDLSTLEFETLYLLIQKKGKVLTREIIMNSIHGVDWAAFDRSIDVLISRLRYKLKDNPKNPVYIKTIWGSGYKFIGYEE